MSPPRKRITIALIAVLCMAMVALAVASIPTERQFQPFEGTPATIPGMIEAENYDTGGQSVAWFDTTPGNQGGAHREDDVDIEAGGSGNVVAFVKSSEWLTYSVDIQEAGEYQATFRASSPWTDRQVWVWVDGVLKAQVTVPETGSFDTYEDATANVTLPAVSHYIRLQFVRNAQNLDFVSFEGAAGTDGQNVTPTPTGTNGQNVTPTPTGTDGQNVTPTPTGTVTPPGEGAPPEAVQYAADWPMPNRDYSNSRASTDSPITAANINLLNLAWAYNLTGIGTFGGGTSNPIILGDTVFFQDLKANVIALNRTTGDVMWMTDYNASFVEGPNGPTAGWGKIFVAKDAYSMAALNATTGDELWETPLSPVNTTGIDIAPAAYDNLVYTSTVPGTGDLFYAPGGIGVLYALDQETGTVVWNLSTVDSPDLWGHPEVNSGGGAWYTPAVDTATGTMYWAIANPAPFPGTDEWPSGSSRPGPNLYTNSLMAVDHASGTMDWFTQVLPHDLFDHDLQIAPILASANISGTQQEIVLSAGKMGKVYAFNRATGALLWQTEVGNHNGNATLDVLPPGTTTVEPAVIGGVETPMAYADGVVYVPVINMITNWTPTSIDFSSFNIDEGTGELVAIDVNTGKKLWVNRLDAINVGSAMVVNDLVFTATFDGTIYAFNRTDGAEVWTYKAPSAINGWPAVAGDTIVWPAGGGGTFGNNETPLLLAFSLSGNQTNETPDVQIVQPTGGATVAGSSVDVSVDVTNFALVDALGAPSVTGQGHIHYFIDVEPPTTPGEPAVTTPGTYVPTINTTYTWQNVSPGMHNFSVELVNNDHTPLVPPVVRTVTVNVTGGVSPTTTATTTTTSAIPTTATPTTMATTAPTTAATTAGGSVSIELTAQNLALDTSSITVPAGAQVTMTFNNQDQSIPHNFALYTDSTASTAIFQGQIVSGPTTTTYTFTAPSAPGTYFFQCDAHPTLMTGQFIVT